MKEGGGEEEERKERGKGRGKRVEGGRGKKRWRKREGDWKSTHTRTLPSPPYTGRHRHAVPEYLAVSVPCSLSSPAE